MSNQIEKNTESYRRLLETIMALRAEKGCPWDRDQTPLSMRRDLMEECFEAIDAITNGDSDHVKEELGDVMLNATMISYMYQQNGDFSIADSLNELCDKLVRRHPHVFKESSGKSQMQEIPTDGVSVLNQWDKIKENVEGRKGNSVLDEVPAGFPPLLKSYKMLKKAAKKNFEWNNLQEVQQKVDEEFAEVREAISEVETAKKDSESKPFTVKTSDENLNKAQLHLEEEFGDLFLSIINYARWLGVDPSIAVERANKKFYDRFSFVERQMKESNLAMEKENIQKMIEFWNCAKKSGSLNKK